jgi:hypothetical protein
MHAFPLTHFNAGAHEPPQSVSVSVPFFWPSLHAGARHTFVVQTLLVQSVPAEHVLPSAQVGHDAPPQSTSVSVPFLTLSRPPVHFGTWQMPPVHTPLVQSPGTAHPLVSAHFLDGAQLPPQSVSVSDPFFTPSVQIGATQVVPLHTPLAQSLAIVHPPPVPHRAHVEAPPQSMPDSEPFFTMSVQLGARHVFVVHTPLTQSVPAEQSPLVAQRGHAFGPPQSMSVSVPFLTPSRPPVHFGTWQTPPVQTPLVQSAATMHALPSAHFLPCPTQMVPPQSTSLSPWFLVVSAHVGALHVRGGPVQTRLWQSVDTRQVLVAGHAPQVGPPQSTSVSLPFLALSVHPGVWQRPVGQ